MAVIRLPSLTNGTGALEFSRDILCKLAVLESKELKEWYDLFKKGFIV